MLTKEEFYKWERASRDTIDVKRCYIDMAGDLVSGLLLSQIIYWFIPGEHGSKLRVEKEGKLWLAKGRTEWWAECRISPKQFDRALKILIGKGLIETKRFRFHGSPTIHIWLNIETLVERVNSMLTEGENPNTPNGEFSSSPTGKPQVAERDESLTKTTSEITSKTTPETTERGKPSPSLVDQVFKAMQLHYGFPERTKEDPIPNYGKEGKAIKRLLERGFNPRQIMECWMEKCRRAGHFKSMVYVNEDIELQPSTDPDKYVKGKYGHIVNR